MTVKRLNLSIKNTRAALDSDDPLCKRHKSDVVMTEEQARIINEVKPPSHSAFIVRVTGRV